MANNPLPLFDTLEYIHECVQFDYLDKKYNLNDIFKGIIF